MAYTVFFKAWAALTGLLMWFFTWRASRFFSVVERLNDIVPKTNFDWPKVSLIIPACNEADTIEPAVESLLKLDYPNLELVLIDDRSTDGTTEIARRLAARDSRINLVEIKTLPPGWLGKVHAIHKGEQAATGDWLLFTDADVHHRAQSLKKAVTACLERGYDFLCVIPSIIAKPFGLKVAMSHLLNSIALSANMTKLQDPTTGDCMGGGAFNLVKREAYKKSRGLEWLRLEVIDDFGLSYALKISGARCGFFVGLDEIELEWYPTVRSFVKGLEKNSFAGFQYSIGALATYCLMTVLLTIGLTAAPILSGSVALAVFTWASFAFYMAYTAWNLPKLIEVPRWIALCLPGAALVMPFVILRAAVICLKQKGIYWRGTFYPLDELRANQRIKILDIVIKRKHA